MKKVFFILIANIVTLIGVYSQEHEAHALANMINVTHFEGQNVTDYVKTDVSIGLTRGKIPASILRTSISNAYTVLVDANPTSNVWPRDFIAYYHVKQNNVDYWICDTIQTYSVPNTSEYDYLFRATNNYGANATLKPTLANSTANNLFAGNTYALIINAVNNEYANYEEYWNECSFMYQTLTKRYNIPKSHIKVLMADGGDNGTIQAVSTYRNTMTSLPMDLDGDGQYDVDGAAAYYNIHAALDEYEEVLTSNDHLFIFVVGDSEFDPDNHQMGTNGIAFLKLWNEPVPGSGELPNFNFSAVNFAYSLYDVQAKVTMLLDISDSEHFVSNLEEAGYQGVVMTSGRYNGLAFHSTYPYGRFVYNWLCGMNYTFNIHSNGAFMLPFSCDQNNNRFITMEEAFNYADSHEDATNPYYSSAPETWGKYMSFNDVARDVDLFIRHSNSDTGNEYLSPSYNPLYGSVSWNSPDMFLRNQQDGNIHQNHDTLNLSMPVNKAYVYVKIRNDNNLDYPGVGQYLHVFWTDTRNLSLPVPRYTTVDISDRDTTMYGAITTIPITSNISMGDSLLVCCEWNIPASIYSFKQDHGHLPPLSYVAILSEHPSLACSSLDQLNRYADRTKSHKYAGLKAEFTHGYGSSLGPVEPAIPFMTPTANVLTIEKPEGGDESFHYVVISDNPDVHVETLEDDENIYVGLSATNGNSNVAKATLHVAKIEDKTETCAGGIDIVVDNVNNGMDAGLDSYSGSISSVVAEGENVTVSLTKPSVEGMQLRVESIGATVSAATYHIERGQTVVTIPNPQTSGNMLNFSLVHNNKVVNSFKFIQ